MKIIIAFILSGSALALSFTPPVVSEFVHFAIIVYLSGLGLVQLHFANVPPKWAPPLWLSIVAIQLYIYYLASNRLTPMLT